MLVKQISFYPKLSASIKSINFNSLTREREVVLQPLIDYIQGKIAEGKDVNLIFICTHNSRRSQLSQIWAKTASAYFGLHINCLSGGIEETAFNSRAVESIRRSGFHVRSQGTTNGVYHVFYSDEQEPLTAYSKLYDDPINKVEPFAAVMTCSHADENCPFIPGSERRIALHYDDPGDFDDTDLEAEKYDERSLQIASEMFYVFSMIRI